MKQSRFPGLVALVLVLSVVVPVGLSAQNAASPVEGAIAAIQDTTITLTLADSTQMTVALQDSTIILDREAATVDQIRTGDALGVAARRDKDALIATSINIFAAPMWDGIRKGQFPMASGDIMTNALAAAYVQDVKGRVLTMKLVAGTATITVPDGIPVHRLLSVAPAALRVGLRVSVRVSKDMAGRVVAATISFDQPQKG